MLVTVLLFSYDNGRKCGQCSIEKNGEITLDLSSPGDFKKKYFATEWDLDPLVRFNLVSFFQ